MKNWMKASVVVLAMASVLSFAACTPKKEAAKKQDRIVAVEKPAVSMESLDKRVSSLERSRAQLRKSFPVVAK